MIRLLKRIDAQQYRQLRLQALQTDPEFFLSTFEVEHAKSLSQFEYELSASLSEPCFGYYGLFAPEDSRKLIGFCQAAPTYMAKQPHVAHFYNLYIDPAYRGRGHARTLLTHILEQLKQFGLEMVVISHIASNTKAHAFYKGLGFVETGLVPKSVKWNGEYDDELGMVLYLQN